MTLAYYLKGVFPSFKWIRSVFYYARGKEGAKYSILEGLKVP
jgi:hypothetical protein